MQKRNFITPIVFEILKLKNPAIWLTENIFAFSHAHLKFSWSICSFNRYEVARTKSTLYIISFWAIKVLKASLGMLDQTHRNFHNQFMTLIDMKLHAQNQLYTSFSFWDLKVLIASLGMPGVLTKTRNDLKPPETSQIIVSFTSNKLFSGWVFPNTPNTLKSFLGKFGLKNWSSPNWLKFGTEVHCYIVISNLMFIPPKILSLTFFWANLIPKSEVLQINWNLVQRDIAICLLWF